MFVKLTHVVNFINLKRANYTYKSIFYSYVLALNKLSYKKRAHKMFMKLTPVVNLANILMCSFNSCKCSGSQFIFHQL